MEQKELEKLLQSAYAAEGVPEQVNIRLKNQLARQKAMGDSQISLWWLPAVAGTIVSVAIGLILSLMYVIVLIGSDGFWMPNLLRLLSEFWLKCHLMVIAAEIIISWLVTIVGVWKGDLIRGGKIY